MPEADPRLTRNGQTKNPSRTPCWDLGPVPLPHSPGTPERGVPVMLLERKDTPDGPCTEISRFDCTCDPPLSCIAPPRKLHGAKGRRQRRRDLARGIAPLGAADLGERWQESLPGSLPPDEGRLG